MQWHSITFHPKKSHPKRKWSKKSFYFYRYPPKRCRFTAKETRIIGPGSRVGREAVHNATNVTDRGPRGGPRIRHVSWGRRKEATISRRLLRRGGFGGSDTSGRVKRREGKGGGRDGSGFKARWGRSSVGPTTRAWIREEIARFTDGWNSGIGTRHCIYGE